MLLLACFQRVRDKLRFDQVFLTVIFRPELPFPSLRLGKE